MKKFLLSLILVLLLPALAGADEGIYTQGPGSTDGLLEGAGHLYYTDARARAALSSTATGLTYTAATGVISLTTGYAIPTTTALGHYDTAYGWGTTNGLLKLNGAYGASAATPGADYVAPTNHGDLTFSPGNLIFTPEAAPAAPTAALVTDGTGLVTAGAHTVKTTFVTATGETVPSSVSNSVTADGAHTKILVTKGSGAPSAAVLYWNVYMIKVGESTWKYVAQVPIATSTYTINVADDSLVTAAPIGNTTAGKIIGATSAPIYPNGNSGSAITVDYLNGNKQSLVVTADCTITLSQVPAGGFLKLFLKNDGSATQYTLTWPSNIKWAGGAAAPALSISGALDIIAFDFDGTYGYGYSAQGYTQ